MCILILTVYKVGGQNDVVVKAANVPVKANYRTNILGDLLTAPGVFNIVIDQKLASDSLTTSGSMLRLTERTLSVLSLSQKLPIVFITKSRLP